MQPHKKIAITVEGYPEQLSTLVHFLMTIEKLGALGASRTLKIWVDGDGAARLRFHFGETDVSEIKTPKIEDTMPTFTLD